MTPTQTSPTLAPSYKSELILRHSYPPSYTLLSRQYPKTCRISSLNSPRPRSSLCRKRKDAPPKTLCRFQVRTWNGEKDDVWVLLKKIVGVEVKGGVELIVGVVCSGVSEESVVVAEEGFREKLSKVFEAKNEDLEEFGLNVVVFEVGFIVKRFSGVDAVDLEGREIGGEGS
ncbi:hypothetical protein V6N13_052119 [Hibiscus sabdariffa]|uniref:Uncharacterized protein n=1 Tax=Hibiscus sabdariffa TaxID=183260 RepID=A0ABR2T5R2_9ROSI